MIERKPILCLDFDGVIHSYTSGWKGAQVIPDEPVEGVFEFLYEAIFLFNVQIYSTRSGLEGGIKAMEEWLFKHEAIWRRDKRLRGEPMVRTSLAFCITFPTSKPPAILTIDDRALTFTGNWSDFDPQVLLDFQPWNK